MSEELKFSDEQLDGLLNLLDARNKLEALSDKKLSALVLHCIWAKKMNWCSQEEFLLDEYITRFERMAGIRRDNESGDILAEDGPKLFPTCDAVGPCPKPTVEAAPFHHFYWDAERDTERMEKIHGTPDGGGHDNPLAKYGAVECKTCGCKALVLQDADDFPEL